MSTSTSISTPTSAAQEVFGIPELVALIVDFIYENLQVTKPNHGDEAIFDRTKYAGIPGVNLEQRRAALAPLACLNRLWFQSIIPVLWRHPTQVRTDPCLTKLLWYIEPERRNLYAQYVESGSLMFTGVLIPPNGGKFIMTKYGEFSEKLLAAVDFPRLKILHVKAQHDSLLPQLGFNCVEYILFDIRGRSKRYEESRRDLLEIEIYKTGPSFGSGLDLAMVGFAERMTNKRKAELGSDTPFTIDEPKFNADTNRFPVPSDGPATAPVLGGS